MKYKNTLNGRLATSIEAGRLETYCEDEDSRDRRVNRTTTVSNDISWFEDKKDWPQLCTFVHVQQKTTTADGTITEDRFYISNLETGALAFANPTRNHWDIENALHWMLDTAFHEDASLIHTGHAPENYSVMRKLALTLLKKLVHPKSAFAESKRLLPMMTSSFVKSLPSVK